MKKSGKKGIDLDIMYRESRALATQGVRAVHCDRAATLSAASQRVGDKGARFGHALGVDTTQRRGLYVCVCEFVSVCVCSEIRDSDYSTLSSRTL